MYQILADIQKHDEVADYLDDVMCVISDTLKGTVPEVEEYVLPVIGKRVRSTMFFLCVKALSEDFIVPPEIGASLELIHTATLLHDDVIDEADIRRGQKSFRVKYDCKFSILAGDSLIGLALDLVWKIKSWRLVKLYSELCRNLVMGEIAGAKLAISDSPSKYYSQIYMKTGSFFEIICKMAAILVNAEGYYAEAIVEYGRIFGERFQIQDDFADYFAPVLFPSKKQGMDFFDKKITLPIIYAYRRSDNIERQLILSIFSKPSAETFEVIKTLMEKLEVDSIILDEINGLSRQAKAALSNLKDSLYKKYLVQLALI